MVFMGSWHFVPITLLYFFLQSCNSASNYVAHCSPDGPNILSYLLYPLLW